MNKKGFIVITIIILLFLPSLTHAEETPATSNIDVLRNTFLTEEIKTRADLKLYLDKMRVDITHDMEVRGQAYVENQVRTLKDEMTSYINKSIIKISIWIGGCIFLSLIIWTILVSNINRLKKKKTLKPKDISFPEKREEEPEPPLPPL